jgi:hypothetical protein
LLTLAVGIASLAWLFETAQITWYSIASAALFLLFGAAGNATRLRTVALAAR